MQDKDSNRSNGDTRVDNDIIDNQDNSINSDISVSSDSTVDKQTYIDNTSSYDDKHIRIIETQTQVDGESIDIHNNQEIPNHLEGQIPASKNQKSNAGKELLDWAITLGVAVILALLIRHFLFAIFIVDGESMYPTLEDSEWLIVNKAVYLLDEPKRGDIIVFHATATRDYIKRVIAVGGDEIHIINGTVYINGEVIDEPYINERMEFYNNYEKMVVPDNKIFVMGDNRNKSADSRMPDIGFIDLKEVVGRAEFIFWPVSNIARIN